MPTPELCVGRMWPRTHFVLIVILNDSLAMYMMYQLFFWMCSYISAFISNTVK